jgi:hypothetical protein
LINGVATFTRKLHTDLCRTTIVEFECDWITLCYNRGGYSRLNVWHPRRNWKKKSKTPKPKLQIAISQELLGVISQGDNQIIRIYALYPVLVLVPLKFELSEQFYLSELFPNRGSKISR